MLDFNNLNFFRLSKSLNMVVKYKFINYLLYKIFKPKLSILNKLYIYYYYIKYNFKFNINTKFNLLDFILPSYPFKLYKLLLLENNLLDFTYYFINVDFIDKYKSFFKNFLNKFMRAGKRYLVEKKFNLILTSNKNSDLFIYLFDSLEYLKPYINIKLFTFKQKGKKKSVKKGKRVKKNIKVIPEQIGHIKSYKVALNWLVSSILNSDYSFKKAIIKELVHTSKYKYSQSIKKRNNVYKLASENRSSFHYRWLFVIN